MAQFFMKMAEAVKKKKLKPGQNIPGCNSYFLCKYLKDTIAQARTYLFCAIRPEVTYLPYTFSTLGFATNASVIKLAPKKATANITDNERKLMAEIQELKAKQKEIKAAMDGENGNTAAENDAMMKQQAEEYGRRGIHLTHFEKDTKFPYFIKLDEDPFLSTRFMYLLSKEKTVFGPEGDIKPLALSVTKNHFSVENSHTEATDTTKAFDTCTLVGGTVTLTLLLTSVSRGVTTKTGKTVLYQTSPPSLCGPWGSNIVLSEDVFKPLLPPPVPNSTTSRRSKRLKSTPAVVSYLKSVTGYYLSLEEAMGAVNSAVSPPSRITGKTVVAIREFVRDLQGRFALHPGFKAGLDLGYRSRTYGGSCMMMILAARCPPSRDALETKAWLKAFRFLLEASPGLKTKAAGWDWAKATDNGGFTCWHHLACKGRGDVVEAL
ncbi:hypothetical protein TrRE_jg10512, partial [Triparma retinervis]